MTSHEKELSWETYTKVQPTFDNLKMKSRSPLELFSLIKDTTDYAWYSTSVELGWRDLLFKQNIKPVLVVTSPGHALVGFVNGKYIGTAYRKHVEKCFAFEKTIELHSGVNLIVRGHDSWIPNVQ